MGKVKNSSHSTPIQVNAKPTSNPVKPFVLKDMICSILKDSDILQQTINDKNLQCLQVNLKATLNNVEKLLKNYLLVSWWQIPTL